MGDRNKWYRRRPFYGVLLVALVALAVPLSQGIAGSGPNATAPVEKHNGDCGDTEGRKVIGKDRYTRSGNTLYVTHKVSGADPGTNYYLYMYDYASCGQNFDPYLGKFKVDASGSGSKSATVDVTGFGHTFFMCDYNVDTNFYDCGLAVKV